MNQEEIMQQLQAAVQAYQSKDLDVAEAIFNQILAVNPKEPNALHLLGCIHKDRGQLQQAVELIQASIREDGSNPIPFLNLGKILSIAGQHENAAGVFQESLKRSQQIPETWFCLGNAFKEIEKIEEAKQAYRNALQLNPAHAGAASNLGALLTDDDELYEAEKVLRKSLDSSPEDINCHVNLGNVLKEEGEVEEAIASYRKAIEVKPDFADAYFNLGNVLKEEGEVEEAIASYRKVVEIQPDNEKAIEYLATALIALDRLDESRDIFGLYGSATEQGSFFDFLRFLADRSEGAYLNAVDLNNSNCINELKYFLLRKLHSWIHVGDWLEGIYDSLYGEMYERFGIQGLDTTNEIYTLKPLQGWILPACNSLTFRVYASRFAVGSDYLQLSGPFSSDINHLSHVGHFYLMLSSRFGEKVDMAGRRIEIKLGYGVDALPSSNLCLGFSARVGDDWRRDERSHSYVELIEESEGVFVADVSPESLKELGLHEDYFTAEKYKLWDPVETAQHASGMFLFLRSPHYPVNPKGSVTIHSLNVI